MLRTSAVRFAVWILAASQAISQTVVVLMITLSALIGRTLAPTEALATLPVATFIAGTALAMVPASLFMGRFGRRPGFVIGGSLGLAGTVASWSAVNAGSFAGFVAGSILIGMYQGVSQYYRFAAADVTGPEYRSRAISWVLAGGVVAAIAGPEIAKRAADWGEVAFAAPFLVAAGLAATGIVLVLFLNIPHTRVDPAVAAGRSLGEIMRQPVFLVAAIGAGSAFAVMTLAMVSTPLAMTGHAHSIEDAALVIQFPVLGMFLPSFFTGHLIHRFGVLPVMFTGLALLFAHVAVTASGIGLPHFLAALTLLGVGWNFMFVGGSTLLGEAHRPEEKAKTQAANDLLVYGFSITGSVSSGILLAALGWTGVNIAALPALAGVAGLTVWYWLRTRPLPA
ncbi:MAG: MFS transporter [Proteobacteria bacterium]|nr:MFS transporter [Pseudomonadota bacterium]